MTKFNANAKVRKPRSDQSKYYVDNAAFYQALVDFRQKVKEAEESGKPRPQIPNYIGHCFMMIAERFANQYKYMNYPFKEEMVSDGVLDCCKYIDKFDPEKGSNPFAYFTQAMKFAFWRRIATEKKYLYTKFKSIENTEIFRLGADSPEYSDIDIDIDSPYSDEARYNMQFFIEEYEKANFKKKETEES